MGRVDRDVEKQQTMNIFVKNPCASQISKDAQCHERRRQESFSREQQERYLKRQSLREKRRECDRVNERLYATKSAKLD